MAGGEDTLVTAIFLLDLVRQICSVEIPVAGDKEKIDSGFKKGLHGSGAQGFTEMNWWSDLVAALQSANNLLSLAGSFQSTNDSDGTATKIATLIHGVTWKLEKSLANVPYDQFNISEEVQEQVALMSIRHKRETGSNDSKDRNADLVASESKTVDCAEKDSFPNKSSEDLKKPETLKIPNDFLCPISLELMRDPVIVATGQTYERSCIQRWIDTGNSTCPKTQQKLEHLTLTPNYVLRSLITQWCIEHKVEQPTGLANGRIKKE
ncbi:hypothetical protein OIU84_021289 [Salix udensis]|uniref:U-box domain-containing protein n=1 Tax=Salix udensis TaxID=889485 RepID=A0AAD6PIT9_9ROSI|nr:hypothetical protein OIU84_021289 [Salix udensis]